MSSNPDYIRKQLARLRPISEENPHYTLQLRGFAGRPVARRWRARPARRPL